VKNSDDDKERKEKKEFSEIIEFFVSFYFIFAQLGQYNWIQKSSVEF